MSRGKLATGPIGEGAILWRGALLWLLVQTEALHLLAEVGIDLVRVGPVGQWGERALGLHRVVIERRRGAGHELGVHRWAESLLSG